MVDFPGEIHTLIPGGPTMPEITSILNEKRLFRPDATAMAEGSKF